MSNYVLSFKFEGVSDEVAEKFADAIVTGKQIGRAHV